MCSILSILVLLSGIEPTTLWLKVVWSASLPTATLMSFNVNIDFEFSLRKKGKSVDQS